MRGIRILLYHSVGDLHPDDSLGIRIEKGAFHSQMEFLKEEGFNVILLKDAINYIKEKLDIPQKTLAITFDDGYKDNIINAVPLMEEFDFYATFFISVEYIGGIKTSPKREWQYWECMDQGDLKSLIERGHDIGSHGYHHIDLRKSTKEEKREELRLSKKRLSFLLNKDIEFFSYPYGYFDEDLLNMVMDEGYNAACTIARGINDYTTNLYKLKRTEIVSLDTQDIFRYKLEGNGGDISHVAGTLLL